MASAVAFEDVLAALHEAAHDDALWPAASALIDEACGSRGNVLTLATGPRREDVHVNFAWIHFRGERDRELEAEYFTHYYARDERIPRLIQLPDSQVVHAAELYSAEERKASPAFREILPRGHCRNSLNVRMDGPWGSRITWTSADPVDGRGWSPDQLEMVERLLPHLRQFVRVRQALVEAKALGASMQELLGTVDLGVMHLDWRGRLVAVNATACAVLAEGDGLVDREGFLHACIPSDDAQLQRLLGRAVRPNGAIGTSGSVQVSRQHAATRLVVHVSPVCNPADEHMLGGVRGMVLVIDPQWRARLRADRIGEILGLTAPQSEVAVLLAEGLTLPEIARSIGRHLTTVKWHLANSYASLGISRQADLVRLVLSLSDVPGVRR